jgi:hypothetical protein
MPDLRIGLLPEYLVVVKRWFASARTPRSGVA